jgi:hypothetical protein
MPITDFGLESLEEGPVNPAHELIAQIRDKASDIRAAHHCVDPAVRAALIPTRLLDGAMFFSDNVSRF